MKDLNFEVNNNTIVVHLTDKQMNFSITVKQGSEQMTEEYKPLISKPDTHTEVKILGLSWKNPPTPGEEYKILGRAQDSKTQQWGDWSVQRWTAPGKKQQIVLRIKKPTTPVADEPPPAPVAAPTPVVQDPIPATSPDPDPSPSPKDKQVILEINERLNLIEKDLDDILESFRLKPVPPQKYLLRVEKTLVSILMAMEEIAVQVKEGLKTSTANYKQVSEKFETCREKARKASQLLDKAKEKLLAKAQQRPTQAQVIPAPAPTTNTTPVVAPNMTTPPAPTTAAPVDLDPINDRINDLEQQLKDVTDQLADKASSGDLTALSGRVDGLNNQVADLGSQVGDLNTTCADGFATLRGAIAGITNPATATTPATTATPTPPASVATATPAVATAAMTATPANVAAATPVAPATTTTNRGGKNKKSGRESVNFFALVLGIVLGVLALIAMFFYTTRSQDISAERIGTSDTKSAALAEIENARRLQVEMMDKMHNLQQNVEGYRRQTFVTPSEPDNAVTNTSTTTNVVIVTNITQVTRVGDISDPRPPMIQRGSWVNGFWSPTLMQDRYGYNHQGFNGYIYPYSY